MPKMKYLEKRFQPQTVALIDRCNSIIAEYAEQGFVLTLRQLYYQLVSRDVIANQHAEYARLGSIVSDARLAGLIDWSAIEDRTRSLRGLSHWESPSGIVQACAEQFHMNLWEGQTYRPEIWIEKDALLGVIEGVCNELDVPHFSCRGYPSQSEMWVAAQRLQQYFNDGQVPILFHLGDHDPSGKDMTRDIIERLKLFMGGAEVKRLALNPDQIEEYEPPPNPVKTTDSRCRGYVAEFGNESWELDALEPTVLAELIRSSMMKLIDADLWEERNAQVERHRETLAIVACRWSVVAKAARK